MKKLAILGASYVQVPLILKAKEMGIETHVFAWEDGAIGKPLSDHFYPISILEKEKILEKCIQVKIDGITTIGTDIAMPSVNYIAEKLNLIGNSLTSTLISTDKFEMRKALLNKGISCPRFGFYEKAEFRNTEGFEFPLIVKPTDRSGSRGVTKVYDITSANKAIEKALNNSINNRVIVEEFIEGDREFSVEFISFNGEHHPLAITDKVTTREPYFVEIEHHQPANISETAAEKIYQTTIKVLNALEIKNGASHTEVYLLDNGDVRVIECAGRMGGDFIGSHLVQLSTGFDFVRAVIDVALNQFIFSNYTSTPQKRYSGVYYVITKPGRIKAIIDNSNQYADVLYALPLMNVGEVFDETIDGADKRAGIIVYSSHVRRPLNNPTIILEVVT